ncbi:MAG: hypothetical protein GY780_18840 [bacterium]|nr:hypothetical protein [bacterium]
MTIAHFLVVNSGDNGPDGFDADFLEDECKALGELPGVERIDRYDAANFDDPGADGGRGPILTIQTCFSDVASLGLGLASVTFTRLVDLIRSQDSVTVSHDALEMMFFPVGDEDEPGEWLAPLSYVVRYHHPTDDLEAFVDFYITHHPQIERRFPEIRSIMCYVPVKWEDPTDIKQENYMLGNEVVFDSAEALAVALAAPVNVDMKADMANFPSFGHITHFAMNRRRTGHL